MVHNEFNLDCLDLTDADAITGMRSLFHQYHAEIGTPPGFDENKYIESVLRRLRQEPDCRWFLMARDSTGAPAGFCFFKIDKDERQGWGYIMEFFVLPGNRRKGLGRLLLQLSLKRMGESGVKQVWLSSAFLAEAFWQACGFDFTGETYENGKKVMTRAL